MSDDRPRVGVRELRQNLSVYLGKVKDGATLQVTEHGRVVARIGPSTDERQGVLDRLISEGRATPPRTDLKTFLATHRPLPLTAGRTGTQILLEMREEGSGR